MATTSGLTSEQLQAKIDALKAQGKTESTSKELGKYVDALKVLNPSKYGAATVASAQQKLASSTQAGAAGGTAASAGLTGSGELSDLEKQLADRQAAIVKAMGDINDNPWYSEATRVGKLAKLQQQSSADIANLNDQIAQKRADQQNALAQSNWERQFAAQQAQANKPQVATVTDNAGNVTAYNAQTGEVLYTLGGAGKASSSGGGGGGGGGAKTTIAAVESDVLGALTDPSIVGPDGYVAPWDFINARNYYIAQGGNAKTFNTKFRSFANPTHLADYGL